MPLPTGTPAPDFTLKTMGSDGLADLRLSDYRGKNVVLLFFPAAFTGVCTQEFCDVSNGVAFDPGPDTVVIGISGDSAFAQHAWAQANGIKTPLASDYSKEVARAYDVLLPDLAGMGPAAARAAFVIDREGVIRYAEQTPTPLELPNFGAIKDALAQLS